MLNIEAPVSGASKNANPVAPVNDNGTVGVITPNVTKEAPEKPTPKKAGTSVAVSDKDKARNERFDQQKQSVTQGLKRVVEDFVKIGEALHDINQNKLYKGAYRSFEDCLRLEWNMSKSHGHRFIDAYKEQKELSPFGDVLPSESVARMLKPIKDPETKSKVFKSAVKASNGKPPTAAIVLQERRKELGQPLSGKASVTKTVAPKATPTIAQPAPVQPAPAEPDSPEPPTRCERIDDMLTDALCLCDAIDDLFPEPSKGEFVEDWLLESCAFERSSVVKVIEFFTRLLAVGDDLNLYGWTSDDEARFPRAVRRAVAEVVGKPPRRRGAIDLFDTPTGLLFGCRGCGTRWPAKRDSKRLSWRCPKCGADAKTPMVSFRNCSGLIESFVAR